MNAKRSGLKILVQTSVLLAAGESMAINRLPMPAKKFKVNGSTAFVIEAPKPGKDKPWVWYAPTLGNYPNKRHSWYVKPMVAAGISCAGINLGEVRGAPASTKRFTAFYDKMVSMGYSKRPILLGQSRGGLMMLAWAMHHPEKVKAFVGIYPVCNLASWPLKSAKASVLKDYGMTYEELVADLKRYNPVDNLAGLLKHKPPMFIIHGNADKVVPYEENSKLLKDRYEAGGGTITVKIVDGGKHEETNAFFECRELLDFILKQ